MVYHLYRLDLNLRSGKNKSDDIVLNISVNFHEKLISRNSRINGEWGHKEIKENFEREDNNLNPIESGEYFCGEHTFYRGMVRIHF